MSSDEDEAHMLKYMQEKHGDWAAVKYDDPMRQGLKQKYGFFPGKSGPTLSSCRCGPQRWCTTSFAQVKRPRTSKRWVSSARKASPPVRGAAPPVFLFRWLLCPASSLL